MGKKETSTGTEWAFASEDVAFKALGYSTVRDVEPGEAILIRKDNNEMVAHQCVKGELNPCIFEYIYLARPDSMMNKISVYKTRLRMGSFLAKQIKKAKLHIDSVMPVPDSGRALAMQVSQDLGIKYREGLVKNHYIGRTFIMPNQRMRQQSIRRKLNTIELEFKNRNILLVDDSIVRGNTSKQIIELCRQAGAKKVFIASGAPPIINPDVYGIDIPTRSELIAHGLTLEEIRKAIGADALFYQKVEDLVAAAKAGNPKIKKFHTGVFDGKYVTPEVTEKYLQKVEREGRGAKQRDSELPLPF
jgi:amidophosphoribosyltransferase